MLQSLDESSDADVWKFALENHYTIVTKDSDFNDMAIYKGAPPKVIWIKVGNCRVVDIENLLRNYLDNIRDFMDDPHGAILEIK